MRVTELISLGQKALEMLDEYIAEKDIKPPIRVYIRHFVTELEISETSRRSQGSSETFQKPEWAIIISDFIKEKVKPMPEFKELNQSIARRYKSNISKLAGDCDAVGQSEFWLEMFIQRLIYEKLEGPLSRDSLIEHASLFKSELELSPSEYRFVHHLDGIFLEADSIRINDNVLIRKTQKDDLEYTRDISSDIPGLRHRGIPSSILEIEISAKDERDCHEYTNTIFNSLRLYKLGSVYSKESNSTRRTIIWPMGLQKGWPHTNYSTFRKYTVRESQAEGFIKFINTVEQKLNFDKEGKEHRTLFISIERYNSALLESVDIDRKLMTAVMGLESLFTREKDRGENAFKLGVRVAKLLGSLNFDPVNVRALTEQAYEFRNKVVHGSYIPQDNMQRMNEILPHILNHLRVSLVIFLLNQGVGKGKMIEMIDQSMISDTWDKDLKKVLESNSKELGEVLT